MQSEELRMQREELQLQREEMVRQRQEMERMAGIQEKQLEYFQKIDAREREKKIGELCILVESIWRTIRDWGDDLGRYGEAILWSENDEKRLLDLATTANENAAYNAKEAIPHLAWLRLYQSQVKQGALEGSAQNRNIKDALHYQTSRKEAADQLATLDVHLRSEPGYMVITPARYIPLS